MDKYCIYCGGKINPKDKFCSNCGKRIKTSFFRKCPKCNLRYLTPKQNVCDVCYRDLAVESRRLYENIKHEQKLIDNGFEKVRDYIDHTYALLVNYRQLYENAELVPKEIEIMPKNYDDLEVKIVNNIIDVLEEKLKYIISRLEKVGDIIYLNRLTEFRNDIFNAKKVLPDIAKTFNLKDLDKCVLCGKKRDNLHEIYYGTGKRQLSIQYGCVIPLCYTCHVKIHNDSVLSILWKVKCQNTFEQKYPNLDFMEIFGRNYK